jgi:hypothetical protein
MMSESAQVSGVDVDAIIEALDSAHRKLPEEALREAQRNRDLLIPRLVDVLRNVTAQARSGAVPEGNAHFFALFLLTEFKAKEALPAILETVSLPGELPLDLFGDGITSTLSRVLVVLAEDRLDIIDSLIGNRELNEYVRWEGAQSYCCLVRDGRIPRAEAVERLRRHLRVAIDCRDYAIAGPLISVMSYLSAREARAEILEAFDRDLVDTSLIDKEFVESSMTEGTGETCPRLDQFEPTAIDDTVEELRQWAMFEEKVEREPAWRSLPSADATVAEPLPDPLPDPQATIHRTAPRVGRNDPCPCGSGKKFKKCCGSPQSMH